MAVRSGEILRTYGIDSVHLRRWREAGFITPTVRVRQGGRQEGGSVWPDWTWRMVALLRCTLAKGESPPALLAVLRACAGILEREPDVPWVVFTEGGDALACYEAAEVVAVHRRETCTTVVAIPSLAEARNP